jgi:hypothetical protein
MYRNQGAAASLASAYLTKSSPLPQCRTRTTCASSRNQTSAPKQSPLESPRAHRPTRPPQAKASAHALSCTHTKPRSRTRAASTALKFRASRKVPAKPEPASLQQCLRSRAPTRCRCCPDKTLSIHFCKHLPRKPKLRPRSFTLTEPSRSKPHKRKETKCRVAGRPLSQAAFSALRETTSERNGARTDNVAAFRHRRFTPTPGDQRRQGTRAFRTTRARKPRHMHAYHKATLESLASTWAFNSPTVWHRQAQRRYSSTSPHQLERKTFGQPSRCERNGNTQKDNQHKNRTGANSLQENWSASVDEPERTPFLILVLSGALRGLLLLLARICRILARHAAVPPHELPTQAARERRISCNCTGTSRQTPSQDSPHPSLSAGIH